MSDIELDDLVLVDDLKGKEFMSQDVFGQFPLSKTASAQGCSNFVIGKPGSFFLLRLETLAEDSASAMAQDSAFFDPANSSFNAPVSSSSNPETEHVEFSIETEEPLQVIICEICTDTKQITQMIKNQTCHHSYCSDCMTKHVAAKIQDSIIAVPCPGLDCRSVFELEACRPWLPEDLSERWDKALCEVMFLQVHKFYCPFEDCSAMMLVENEKDQQTAGETECPVCHRVFCPRCDVPWHTRVECKKYQKLNKNKRQMEDWLLRKLAKEKRWRRCPKCKFYVERISGCERITCRTFRLKIANQRHKEFYNTESTLLDYLSPITT
ncbi:hypothetical protein K1719_027818 [Acacia pycnantha]|nr:hypothetical protein K1719_027818 [Acacia pycnantha]